MCAAGVLPLAWDRADCQRQCPATVQGWGRRSHPSAGHRSSVDHAMAQDTTPGAPHGRYDQCHGSWGCGSRPLQRLFAARNR